MSAEKQKPANEEIAGYECRHVVYCPPPQPGMDDIHLIKRVIHFKDGTTKPNLVAKPNFERKFWIEQPGQQNHREKREFADRSNLIEIVTTESKMEATVRRKLRELTEKSIRRFGLPWPGDRDNLRKLNRSPYLYGTDVTSTTLIKKMYQDMFPDQRSASTVATTDTETNMFSKEQEIIMQTLTMKDRVLTVIKRDFFKGHSDVENRLRECFNRRLADDIRARGLKWEIKFVDTAGQIVVEIMKAAHEWMPDFLAIWNIKFDMVKMLEALKADNIDPAKVFSDPRIVAQGYEHFEFKIGQAMKKKADGGHTPLAPSAQWHVVTCPASFYFIDAMCAYRQIRQGQQEEPSYALDALMDKHIKRQKLKLEEADGFREGEWHRFMQEFYKFDYVVYNVFDCIGMEILDEKTGDLNLNFPLYSGPSDYAVFPSQPKKLCNKLFFHLLKEDRVLGCTSDDMTDENDKLTVIGKGWITMLPAHLVMDNGLRIMQEMHNVPSNIRVGVGDLDIAGTYPNEGICMNISKYTTHRELISIEGIPDHIRRRIGFNIAGGHVNAVEICVDLYKAPTLDDMWVSYRKRKGLPMPTIDGDRPMPVYPPSEPLVTLDATDYMDVLELEAAMEPEEEIDYDELDAAA